MTTDAPGVFISYRRKESSGYAGRIHDRLVERLGKDRVFMDVDAIRPGENWIKAISNALAKCGVMLVLIGEQWDQVTSDSAAQIGDTGDPVRNEIDAAFDQGIPVIPVLLRNAEMPRHADLPDTLVRLSHIQAIRVRHDTFESDAARLLEAVDQKLRTRSRIGLARRLLVPLLTLICLVAVGFATWTFTTTRTVAEEIAEPIGTAVNPFLEGVGQDVTQTPPPKAAGQVRGDTEGLYGGTRRGTSCDAAKLVAFLQTHPEKGAAWAGVLKLTLQQIPPFVSQLTPLILRADTRVTNHGFEDGRVTSFYSILQAGTAVLVDKQGVPVVKCFCGNPLTPPRPVAHSYQGKAWPGFDAQKVIVIKPAPAPIKSFTVVDHTTGKRFSKKTGAKVPPANPEPATTPQSASLSPSPTSSPSDTASLSPSPTSSPSDTASLSPSPTSSPADTASPTPSVPPSTADPTIESEPASPTESDTTDDSAGGSSPDRGESQGSSGSEQTDGNGNGETQTGTDNQGETDNNEGDTGTNGGAGTNRDTGGGATSSAGPR
jgi:TIR domain